MPPKPASESVSNLPSDAKDTRQFVGFQIEDQLYAFPIERIQEIVILEQITATPQVAPHVDGVSNLRGEIIPIINLRKLLGMPPRPFDSETRTIVVNVGTRTMGCTVDAVTQVIRIPRDHIQEAPEALTGGGTHDIAGFAKLDERVLILLNVDQLLGPDRLVHGRQGDDSPAPLPPP
jgi:purine-binding chemotaxis protein CheW